VPYLALASHANPTPLDYFVPANPAFDFRKIVKTKGAGWLHRAYVGKDIPIKVTCYGWPNNLDDHHITTLIYSLGLPILSSSTVQHTLYNNLAPFTSHLHPNAQNFFQQQ
jgi:hypothetical protein